MVEEPINLSFALLVQINLQHIHAQPYGICTRNIYLTKNHLYVQEHDTDKQLVPFFKVFVMTQPRLG